MPPLPDTPRPSRRDASSVVFNINVVIWVLLLATGLFLVFWYRPGNAWLSLGSDENIGLRLMSVVPAIHRGLGLCAVVGAIALAATSVGARRIRPVVGALCAALFMVGAGVTGLILPWDQVGLNGLPVGSDLRGFIKPLTSEEIAFFLLDGVEVSVETMRTWFVLHVAVWPMLAVAALLVSRLRRR